MWKYFIPQNETTRLMDRWRKLKQGEASSTTILSHAIVHQLVGRDFSNQGHRIFNKSTIQFKVTWGDSTTSTSNEGRIPTLQRGSFKCGGSQLAFECSQRNTKKVSVAQVDAEDLDEG